MGAMMRDGGGLLGPPDLLQEMFGSQQESETPFQKKYFSADMMSRFEPLADAMQEVNERGNEDEDVMANFEKHWASFMDFSWCSQWNGKKYDIVFYGVSGYSGYLVMEYLKRNVLRRNEALSFAFAGRTASKVVEMRDREFAGTPWAEAPVLVADFDDVVSVIDLVKSAHVIVNLAGPYMLTEGEVLIDACIWCKTDYVDVSQEIPWSLRIKELHRHAVDAGVMVVPSAGGNAYADLGVYLLAKKLREDFGESVRSATCYCSGGGDAPGVSGGTLKTRSAMGRITAEEKRQMNDPFSLGGFIPEIDRNGVKCVNIQQGTGYVSVKVRDEDKDSKMLQVTHDAKTGVWRAPHVNSFFDTRVVRRSNMLQADLGNQPYGTTLNFTEYAMLPAGQAQDLKANALANVDSAGAVPIGQSGVPFNEEQGKKYNEGEGPQIDDMDAWTGFFLYAESVNGNNLKCSFVGGDGYQETARMAVETALTLRFDREKLQFQGGVLTPSTSGGGALVSRLLESGVKFKMGSWLEALERSSPGIDASSK